MLLLNFQDIANLHDGIKQRKIGALDRVNLGLYPPPFAAAKQPHNARALRFAVKIKASDGEGFAHQVRGVVMA
jgi:hypothetical protein